MRLELVDLGATTISDETNACLTQATIPITGGDDKATYGEVQTMSALGLTARSYPETPEGKAEGVIVPDVGNEDGIIVGARDTRSEHVYGELEPGDTALHACDPEAASMVICYGSDKERNKVLAMTKDTAGDNILLVLDGKNDAIQISGFGLHFEMSKTNGITMSDGGATFTIKDGTIILSGQVQIGGVLPTHKFMVGTDATFAAIKALPGMAALVFQAAGVTSTGM